ncbi:unnamed protein product [Lathyrus sativus]|nr:unnamed protein product [Lathyrus sativus]
MKEMEEFHRFIGDNAYIDVPCEGGKGDFMLKEKLRRLKVILITWNKEVFRWINLKVKEVVWDLNDLDAQVSSLGFSCYEDMKKKRLLA